MSAASVPSLKQRLLWRLLAVQSAILVAVIATLIGSGLVFDFSSTDSTIEILRKAVARDAQGMLVLTETSAMRELRRSEPDLWFVIRDRDGNRLAEGDVPAEYAELGGVLDQVSQARLGWNIGDPDRPTARMRWADSDAGKLQFTTGTAALMSPLLVFYALSLVVLKEALPILAVIALGTFVATPWVVRRSLAGVERVARQADAIDVEQRGSRLSAGDTPQEIAPLVRAVNGALDRLDEGYERQERFLADGAHELRTPLAILGARIGALPRSSVRSQLEADAARLALIVEQMLDLQRLRAGTEPYSAVNLERLARLIVLDVGPLAFAAGYQLEFSGEFAGPDIRGDRRSIERALTNLIQNAIDHGGGSGTLRVTVGNGWIDVEDEGAGIPAELRERVFEPFYKGHKDGRGAGLGLSLVEEVMRRHGGRVSIQDRNRGACLRLSFPVDMAVPG
jgi:signal transduction histidine kinase